jgi:hypothetical protein
LKDVNAVSLAEKNPEKTRQIAMITSFSILPSGIKTPFDINLLSGDVTGTGWGWGKYRN